MNSFFHTSSEFIPGIIIFLVIVTMIITLIAYKSGSSVGKFSIITKELIENYILCDPSKLTPEISTQLQIFNIVLLSKPIHLTFLGIAPINKRTIGAILFGAILPNSGRLISHFYPSTSES